jgi:hypothetical protein
MALQSIFFVDYGLKVIGKVDTSTMVHLGSEKLLLTLEKT